MDTRTDFPQLPLKARGKSNLAPLTLTYRSDSPYRVAVLVAPAGAWCFYINGIHFHVQHTTSFPPTLAGDILAQLTRLTQTWLRRTRPSNLQKFPSHGLLGSNPSGSTHQRKQSVSKKIKRCRLGFPILPLHLLHGIDPISFHLVSFFPKSPRHHGRRRGYRNA